VRPRSGRRAALEAYGLPIVPGEITDRRAFARAVTTGSAVTEFEAEGKAAGGNPGFVGVDQGHVRT
jgi:chromosome partitioning protein